MAKSPFAEKKAHTYTYPEPIDPAKEQEALDDPDLPGYQSRIDPEVMEEDPRPWITFRIPRSKSDVDAIADLTQSLVTATREGAKLEQRISQGNAGVFELLVEAWSFDAEANGANFRRLDTWAADWITACLADAVDKGTSRDWAEGNASSSNGRGKSPSRSPRTRKAGSASGS